MDDEETTAAINLPEEDDNSLDDFFAKKDKGKKKKKSKFVTTEALAKTLENISTGTEEESEKPTKKEKESTEASKGVNTNDVEEWHEFEDESSRDYSDLKIQNFQISEQVTTEVPEPQYDEEGELISPKEEEGPWKNRAKDSTETTPMTKPVETTREPVPLQTSVYRPPHARLSSNPTSSPGMPPGRRRRPQAKPVIDSEIDFPSLASAVQDTEQHVGFETVKSGAKSISRSQQQQNEAAKSTDLTLGNQFEALGD